MRILFVGVCAVSLVGCLNTSTVIRVAPDGSGTIEQTLLFNPKSIENAFASMGMKPTGKSSTSEKNPIDAEAMKKAAEELGNGVTLVSVTPVKEPSGFEGVTARFRFDDISKLQTEDLLMPTPAKQAAPGGGADSGKGQNRIAFKLTRGAGGTSTLTATFDEPKGGKKAEKGGGKSGPNLDDPEMAQMIKTLFKGFRIGVDLEVVGQIVKTDADYVNGKRITLAEIDVAQLLAEGKKLESLEKVLSPDASIAEVRPYLKDVKGLKINKPVVTVEFR
jgi:hypothetical protein